MKKTSKKSQKSKPKFQTGTSYMPNTQRRLLPKGMSFSTNAPYDFGQNSYINKRYGDLSNPENIGDISPELKKRLLASNINLGYGTNIGKDRLNLSTQVTPFGSKQQRFGPLDVNYQKNLGAYGQLNYTGSFDKNTNLKKAFNPQNFNYSNTFGSQDGGVRGSINVAPKRSVSGQLDVDNNLSVNYNRRKDDQGTITSVGGTLSPSSSFSLGYNQDFRPGKVLNQRLTGNYNTDNISASGYRNVGAEEGKTFGGSFSKNSGDFTYGASADYGKPGLKNLSANVKGSDLFDLSYQRNRMEDNNFQNTVGLNFMPGQPFSLNYSRTYGRDQMPSSTVGGSLNTKNTQASLSKDIAGENAGMYTGSVSQKIGPVNLTASGTRNNQGTQGYNVGADVNLFGPTRKNPNRGALNINASYGKSKDETGQYGKPDYNIGLKYGYSFKKGGQTKNDKAMVSGVSSILRKIKDKKNRKEVAGDMVKQFNREGVNYNKEKFLKNSRSFQGGGRATRADSIAVLNSQLALNKFYDKEKKAGRIKPTKSSFVFGNTSGDLMNLNNQNLNFYRGNIALRNNLRSGLYDKDYKNFYNFTPQQIAKLEGQGIAMSKLSTGNKAYYRDLITPLQNLAAPFALIDSRIKPQGMIDYQYLKQDYPGGNVQVFDYDPLAITPWDMLSPSQKTQRINKYGFSGTPYKNKADYIKKTTASKTPKTTTSTVKTISPKSTATTAKTSSTTIPSASTPSTSVSTTITSNTVPTNTPNTLVQTSKQLPGNTPQMQRYNYMSLEDKKRAVKKYGDPSKVPFQGVDLNQLRKEVPTFKKGGQHGGLDRWFAEKWVDVKSGKPCGRQEGENRAYPACRPSKRISSKTPKTSSELSSKEKARFKATKTSSQRIPYNHKRK